MASLMQAQHEMRRASKDLRSQNSRDYNAVPMGGASAGPRSDLEGLCNIARDHYVLVSMLAFVPVGFFVGLAAWPPQLVFIFNFLGIMPLAWLIGKATEDLSASVGETLGGLLNATFGNVVEMLLCFSGIRNDEIIVVQCTLIGSILSNLLLVLGCAFLVGGCFYKTQRYSQQGASCQCSLMAMACFAIGLPTIYASILRQDREWEHMVQVSRVSSICLLVTYFAYLYFQLKTHADLFEGDEGGEEEPPDLSPPSAALLLALATITTSFATEFLIKAIRGTVDEWGVSEEFVGIIMLPIIGNAAEHYTAIIVAARNKMDLSLGVAVGSSCQMALLVTPAIVLYGWTQDKEMTLDFHTFQLAVLLLSVFLATSVLSNGTSNWLEGLMLLVTYVVLSLIYFYEGSGKDASLATLY